MKKYKIRNQQQTFREIVIDVIRNSPELDDGIKGLLIFAEHNARQDDIDVFMNWLINDQLTSIDIKSTTPPNHFICATGRTWSDMAEFYRLNHLT